MAFFTHPVKLRGTRLFATIHAARHVLVVEVDCESASPNALLVPIPAIAGTLERIAASELALGWDGRRRLFDDLDNWYHGPPVGRAGGGQAFFAMPSTATSTPVAMPAGPPAPTLFYPSIETSLDAVQLFEPSQTSSRLEPPLRALFGQRYPGHALALCPFPEGTCRIMVAIRYAPLDATHIFFPLLQITDGSAPAAQISDEHDVLGQGVELAEQVLPDQQRQTPLAPAPPPPFPSFVHAGAPLAFTRARGLRDNQDLCASPSSH